MLLTDGPESMEKILKAIDATIVFHNIMMKFNKDELLGDVDLDDASVVTAIDDPDRAPIPGGEGCFGPSDHRRGCSRDKEDAAVVLCSRVLCKTDVW